MIKQKIKSPSATFQQPKTKVMIDALAHYLSCVGDVPLIDRVAEIEQRVAVLEASIKNMN